MLNKQFPSPRLFHGYIFVSFVEGIGSFTFNFGMYESEAFARRYSSYPVKVNTRDRLFFQASAIVQDSSLTLLIDQCYSTPNMNRFYHKKYMIIDNGYVCIR